MPDHTIHHNIPGTHRPCSVPDYKRFYQDGGCDKTVRRGDVHFCRLSESCGCVQRGKRPVVVVQNNTGNDNSTTVIVVPLTRAKIKRPYPMQFDICIPDGLISRVLCEQLITIDKCQLEDRIYRLQADELEKLDRCLKISLGL